MTPDETHVLDLNRKLLDAIAAVDWPTYAELCDETLTCFEPEARGHFVAGLDFHRYYFDLGSNRKPVQVTICAPNVRIVGEVAIVCYSRLTQRISAAGAMETLCHEETRVWRKNNGKWKHIHFHRSLPG